MSKIYLATKLLHFDNQFISEDELTQDEWKVVYALEERGILETWVCPDYDLLPAGVPDIAVDDEHIHISIKNIDFFRVPF